MALIFVCLYCFCVRYAEFSVKLLLVSTMQSPMFKYPFMGDGILIIIVATHTIDVISAVITILLVF